MVSSKKLNIVLDIGKTNVKLTFVDSINSKTIKFFTTKQKNTYRHGIKILNSRSAGTRPARVEIKTANTATITKSDAR